MFDEFLKWLLGVITSSGLTIGVAFLMRDTVAKFFSKAVEHRFDKKLETFKAGIRENENQLEQIRSFLVSARRARDSTIQEKILEGAEILLRARHGLSQLSMLVEYIKILNTEKIIDYGNDPKITQFIETLIKPFDNEKKFKQLSSIDKTIPKLYLSENSLKLFDAYESIMLHAAIMMKIYSTPLTDKKKLINSGSLSKVVIPLVPASKDGFDKWGEGYAYHLSTYLHDEILKALRHEVSGTDDMTRDTESIQKLELDARRAQMNIRSSLKQFGLTDNLIKPDVTTEASSAAAERF